MRRRIGTRGWWGRAAVLALLGLGWAPGGCTCGRSAGPGPITDEERQRIPGVIAFVSERATGEDASKDIWLVRPTGEETQLTRGPEDEFPAAASPDGTALLMVAARELGDMHREQLRLVPIAGGEPVSLHAPRGRARNPSWAPDGTWLVAESDARGFSDLVRMAPRPPDAAAEGLAAAEGAEPVPLATATQGNFEPSVSPDGKHVAFVSSREGDPEIYVMDADGANVRRLTAFHKEDWAPQWSPDGGWIAFLSTREGRPRVFVVRPDGTGTRAVSGSAATGEEREPAWSPDGRTLAFVGREAAGRARIWAVAIGDGGGADSAGDGVGEPVALTDGNGQDDQPAWSPDGKYLVFVSERTGDAELFLMRADGSGQTRLTASPGADWLPRWLMARPGAGDE